MQGFPILSPIMGKPFLILVKSFLPDRIQLLGEMLMKKFKLRPITLVELLAIVFMSAIIIAVWVQVFSRFFLPTIPRWTGEEATTFLMIWMVMMGAAVSMGYDGHIKVDIIAMISPPRVRLWVKRLAYLILIVFLGYFSYIGYVYVIGNWGMSTPRLSIPYWLLQGSIPFGCSIMLAYGIYYFVRTFTHPEIILCEKTMPGEEHEDSALPEGETGEDK